MLGNSANRHIGVLLHRKLVDIGIVDDLLPVKIACERMKLEQKEIENNLKNQDYMSGVNFSRMNSRKES